MLAPLLLCMDLGSANAINAKLESAQRNARLGKHIYPVDRQVVFIFTTPRLNYFTPAMAALRSALTKFYHDW
ncbi:hypothetical protein KWH19_20810 [Xanthomonas campestris pv. pennamericanum]|nr:hypothetical protein [Xanthomonas campestris pv. pennamericanum]